MPSGSLRQRSKKIKKQIIFLQAREKSLLLF